MSVRQFMGRFNRWWDLTVPRIRPFCWMVLWGTVAFGLLLGWSALESKIFKVAWLGSLLPLTFFTFRTFGSRTATVTGNIYGGAAHAALRDTSAVEMLVRLLKEPRPYIGRQNIVGRDRSGDLQRTHTDETLRVGKYGYETSLETVGHSGSGKTQGLGVTNTLLYRSLLIVDPAGEMAAMTARKREKMGFGKSIILNPYNYLVDPDDRAPEGRSWLKSVGFNPLYAIPAPTRGQNEDADDEFVSGCTVAGNGIIHSTYRDHDSHWVKSAKELGIGLIMWECVNELPEKRSFGNIRRMICGGEEGLVSVARQARSSGIPEMNNKLSKFADEITPELRSIISALQTQTAFLDDKRYARDLLAPGGRCFEWEDLKKQLMTVYLIIPPSELAADAGGRWWLRMVVNEAVSALLRTPNNQNLPPVLMMLDEFPHLGFLPSIATAVNLVRKHGLAFWFFSQDINLLRGTYGSLWHSIESACGTKICYRARDLETAEHFSRLTGRRTEIIRTENMHHTLEHDTYGYKGEGMPLYSPQEIMGLPDKTALVVSSDIPGRTIEVHTPGVYERELAGWGRGMDPNPYAPKH